MKRKYLSSAYLVAASAVAPQVALAHSGVDDKSILVNILHTLAHFAGVVSVPGLLVIGLCVAGIACIRAREKKS